MKKIFGPLNLPERRRIVIESLVVETEEDRFRMLSQMLRNFATSKKSEIVLEEPKFPEYLQINPEDNYIN